LVLCESNGSSSDPWNVERRDFMNRWLVGLALLVTGGALYVSDFASG
jgi:hypothetical protein